MRRETAIATLCLCLTIVAASAIMARGGPLDPPAGPVAPTYKTLVEVEPRIAINETNTPGDADSLFRIDQPGSYYLTGNVQAPQGVAGIEIASSEVTIDLMGFRLRGNNNTLDGVRTVGNWNNVTVRNGVVNSWSGDGVDLADTGNGLGCRVENVLSHLNGGIGIKTGIGSVVNGCSVTGNGLGGIQVNAEGVVAQCVSTGNGGRGIRAGDGAVVRDCSVRGASEEGIFVGFGSTVIGCAIRACQSHGIEVNRCATISGCTSSANDGDGIFAVTDNVIVGNTCNDNDAAGVHVASTDNRIEDNMVNENNSGIDADGVRNLVIRNSAQGNFFNYSNIAAGNFVGTIVTSQAQMNGAENANVNWSF